MAEIKPPESPALERRHTLALAEDSRAPTSESPARDPIPKTLTLNVVHIWKPNPPPDEPAVE